MNKETKKLLTNLTNKENIKLVQRGNNAILYALKIAKKLKKTKILIQDQGGWITYKQFPKKLKLELIVLKTNQGLIQKEHLKNIDNKSALLINSMTGYAAIQDMNLIQKICKKNNCLLINDITGTIGTKQATIGDILVCSFGNYKPINIGKGGLIAVKNKEWFKLTEIQEEDFPELKQKLTDLPQKLFLLKKITNKIKQDLKEYNILHKNKEGINVLVKFNNEKEKNKIIKYCENNNFKYKICKKVSNPINSLFSFIKVNEDAISIEVQRL